MLILSLRNYHSWNGFKHLKTHYLKSPTLYSNECPWSLSSRRLLGLSPITGAGSWPSFRSSERKISFYPTRKYLPIWFLRCPRCWRRVRTTLWLRNTATCRPTPWPSIRRASLRCSPQKDASLWVSRSFGLVCGFVSTKLGQINGFWVACAWPGVLDTKDDEHYINNMKMIWSVAIKFIKKAQDDRVINLWCD